MGDFLAELKTHERFMCAHPEIPEVIMAVGSVLYEFGPAEVVFSDSYREKSMFHEGREI